ncbi:hypothetical protein Dtox_3125 [Desulfofarcimen acetoxidans DSM 771]|uniref:Uncharacterized protein n=1 Tax=Desulfofarcimen acetoxidans (strain ATCC 49208 / DSM 771 / KCTC 5769 / VKM B-1644 / 5575) TaxID=485916 RepID=C8W4J0_DESAS|nr:hypothetical protein Dtox_3125 [Desulfofarcimen acetoxidans DSM 771]
MFSHKVLYLDQVIAAPALAYSVTVLIRSRPVAVAENTNNKRVSCVIGIDNSVVILWLVLPSEIVPVRAGANVTTAPGTGLKVLLGVVELYNCAVMVIVVPVRLSNIVLLKYAVIDVMVPDRGAEKAKLINGPVTPPVRSIVSPEIVMPVAELTNPTILAVPTSPSAMVVITMGPPDANGIIAPVPAVPVGVFIIGNCKIGSFNYLIEQ